MRLFYPLVSFATVILLWEVAIRIFNVPNYILPNIGQVLESLQTGYIDGSYWPHLSFTLTATVTGYLSGAVVALVLGAVLAEIPIVERFVFPLVIAIQSMPKVALAPLVIVWFGFGIESKIVMVALICFFPIFVNVIVGLRSVDPNLVDMMRICGASRLDILREVKLPHAASPIFAGLQIAVVMGLIGAVVGEFIASTEGLGFLIQTGSNALDLGTVFAGLISLAVIGVCGTQLLRFLHTRIVFWDRKSFGSVAAGEG
ncbi:ABC transporter permease [uncultured Ferrovibrio sp.]|uniref:ABC transporter permease n=1 Tax=uncultured Ferrovibrio sp. TaxID=1576913 RepID=UPI002626BD87|nr:ABC transporter permease [uncultured Ferrovibrio sp.]